MYAKVAVLRIVKVDNFGPCDIYLKTANGKYVSGLKAKKNEAGYEVETSDTKVSVFYKDSNGNAGIYYVIVPAGVYLEVWNEDRKFKTTSKGLSAGKYYTLTSGPTYGTATATINGETKTRGWVQLWYGGPRIATENVAEKIAFKDDVKKGKDYVWGSLWRTPSCSDVSSLYYNDGIVGSIINNKLVTPTYDYQDKPGLTLTGTQPGYIKNSLFLPGSEKDPQHNVDFKFLLSDGNKKDCGTTMNFVIMGGIYYFAHVTTDDADYTPYTVRPVLSQETVKWGEQDIK